MSVARAPLVLLVLASLAACIDPADRRPGLRLSGEVVAGPTDDWSFANAHPEIWIETSPPWLLPHSVTIICAATPDGERFFVGARNPERKRWVANLEHDSDVRLEIDGRIYEKRLRPLEPDEVATAYAAYAAKYGWPAQRPADAPPLRYWEVVERAG